MVRLYVKRGDQNQFLFDTKVSEDVTSVLQEITAIYNGRLKVQRLCYDIEDLANHGTMLPPEMIGLTDEQIEELKLKDTWADKCIPSGGFEFNKDDMGRRNGQQPKENMRAVLFKAIEDARNAIDKKLVENNTPMTLKIVQEAIHLLRGAVTIVYPMELPPHDVIRMEFTNTEDLTGTQASKEVIEPCKAQLWFAGHQLMPGKKLSDSLGTNDKTKVVVKLVKLGEGPPGREAIITEDVRKRMMADAYRRQEELKKLEQDDDDQYFNSPWADSGSLKRQVHGLENLKFRFGK
ncbi:cilia- and flagella-associated protein 298-like isoform X2 [Eupeodes corollae]|uniref:cilia- and flagella-associated protein 298-like isoform X2 n=1 Tax=Eupeodes corollae TaxID=290404 RepID=UPI0024907489|nr:cilia- and flagella-associated protein 298-like isoform X2 [Eupeodes corollae]